MISTRYFPVFQAKTLSGQKATWKHIVAAFFGVLLLVMAPYVHFGIAYRSWNAGKEPVNKTACKCACWDTYFKGTYQMNTPGYKHMYFNITSNMFKMWAFTIITVVITYEVVKRLVGLFQESCLRMSMFLLFCSVFYSHYYSWWAYINIWNDEFYKQWYHQSFFSLTELLSTTVVVYLCNQRNPTHPRLLLAIINIAVLHILASGRDQFMNNVFRQRGAWHQCVRDLGLMIPDLLHLLIPLTEMWKSSKSFGFCISKTLKTTDIIVSVIVIILLWSICDSL